jgi:hypothetical protein
MLMCAVPAVAAPVGATATLCRPKTRVSHCHGSSGGSIGAAVGSAAGASASCAAAAVLQLSGGKYYFSVVEVHSAVRLLQAYPWHGTGHILDSDSFRGSTSV